MCPVKLWRTSSLNGMSLLQMKLVPSHMRHQQIGRLQLPALLASVHAAFPKYPDKCCPWVTFMCEFLPLSRGYIFLHIGWWRVAIFKCEDTGQGSTISGWRSVKLRTSYSSLRSSSGSTKEPRQKQTGNTKRWQMCVVKTLFYTQPWNYLLVLLFPLSCARWQEPLLVAEMVSSEKLALCQTASGLQGPRMFRPLWSCGRFHAPWPINFYLLACLTASGIESLTAMNSHSLSFYCCLVRRGRWSCQGCCSPSSALFKKNKQMFVRL